MVGFCNTIYHDHVMFLKLAEITRSSRLGQKGPMLCEVFFKAIRIENQVLRQEQLKSVGKMIRAWAGL